MYTVYLTKTDMRFGHVARVLMINPNIQAVSLIIRKVCWMMYRKSFDQQIHHGVLSVFDLTGLTNYSKCIYIYNPEYVLA